MRSMRMASRDALGSCDFGARRKEREAGVSTRRCSRRGIWMLRSICSASKGNPGVCCLGSVAVKYVNMTGKFGVMRETDWIFSICR